MREEQIERVFKESKVIAVVGLSPREDRPSHRVARYLQEAGYRIIPVNPAAKEILGERSYGSLSEIPEEIRVDVVDVFRRPEDVTPIAQEAIKIRAKCLWLQEGIVNDDAATMAKEAGLVVVQDRCMLKEHRRLFKGQGVN